MKRRILLVVTCVTAVLAAAAAASAVSDGNYSYQRQHCSGAANNANHPESTEEGCHSMTLVVADGQHEYAGFGLQQTADGETPQAAHLWVDLGSGNKVDKRLSQSGVEDGSTDTGGDPAPDSGLHFYFGADDNLDEGEHDSSPQVNNGPSDGGAIQLNVTPDSVAPWLAALAGGDASYLLTHPLPLVDFGMGFCADGICITIETTQRKVFQGGNDETERDAADYSSKPTQDDWDPASCSGPSDDPAHCGTALEAWNAHEGAVYAEPGVNVYEDPDAQASPLEELGYPMPAAYVGTCGVILGGGYVGSMPVPPSPVMANSAGQLVIETGC